MPLGGLKKRPGNGRKKIISNQLAVAAGERLAGTATSAPSRMSHSPTYQATRRSGCAENMLQCTVSCHRSEIQRSDGLPAHAGQADKVPRPPSDRLAERDDAAADWRPARYGRWAYLLNSYRVLLTRARQGMVVFVPPGDDADPTRAPDQYDRIFEFLSRCGFARLEGVDGGR